MENNSNTTMQQQARRPQFLDEVKPLVGLTEDDIVRLMKIFRWEEFRKGEVIDGQRVTAQYLFYINRGIARTYYIEGGREVTYAFSFEGQFIIKPQSSVLRKNRQTIFIQFLQDTEVCYFSINSLNDIEGVHSEKFYKMIVYGMLRHIEYLEEQQFMMRLGARERYRRVVEQYPHLLEMVSVTQLAMFLDVTKETLYRIRSGKY